MFKMRPVFLTFMILHLSIYVAGGLLLPTSNKPLGLGAITQVNVTGKLLGAGDEINHEIIKLTGNESLLSSNVLNPIDTLKEISYNTANISFFDPTILDGKLKFNNYDPLELFNALPGYGKTWMYFPDGNGIPQVATLQIPQEDSEASSLLYYPTVDHVVFHLYTRNNVKDSQILKFDNETLSKSHFDPTKKTKFVIHGWQSSVSSNTCQDIKNNYLEAFDYNVICVDWSSITSNIIYPIPMFETRNVGIVVANFVDFLVEHGANIKDIHLLGHSLGAHTCGIAGQNVKSGKVSRITGMDPALPGFALIAAAKYRLDPSDADFVDIIHTCSGILGVFSNIGHADYFPNGGVPKQPGCDGIPQIIEACSHGRAWEFFANSIKHRDEYVAVLCNSWESFVNGDCVTNPKTPMGDSVPLSTRGIFYLKTSSTVI